MKRFDPQHLWTAFERSQERLARDVVDGVLLHNPPMTAINGADGVRSREDLKKAGKIRSGGAARVGRRGAERDREERGRRSSWRTTCSSRGTCTRSPGTCSEERAGVLARSVLAHGLLAGQWTRGAGVLPGRPPGSSGGRRPSCATRIRQLDALRQARDRARWSALRAVALRFALSNQLVSSAVLGPRSVNQLEQLVREAGMPPYLRDTALAELVDAAEEAPAWWSVMARDGEIEELARIARRAAEVVLEVYATPFDRSS